MLEYTIAFYPFFLILATYMAVLLCDYRCPCVTCIWRPISRLSGLLRKNWDIHTSVIDSFATFFLLSYIKIMSATFDILVFTPVYKFGSTDVTYRLFYDPTVIFLGDQHLPYAIIAFVIFSSFIVFPTMILMLYPSRCFHNCLSLFSLRLHFLHTFVDSFQGCFKDGTEAGECDVRWISVFRLLLRIVCFVTYALTLGTMYFVYANIILVTVAIIYITIQPFKKTTVKYPVSDTVFLLLLSVMYVASLGYNVGSLQRHKYLPGAIIMIGAISGYFPLIYTLYLISHWIFSRRKFMKRLNV